MSINGQLETLVRQVEWLQAKVTQLEADEGFIVPITTLEPEPFELLREIKVVIQPCADEYLATFFDANMSAQGANETEALANLKDVMLRRFEFYSKQPARKLGPEPKRQLAVLRHFIRKRR